MLAGRPYTQAADVFSLGLTVAALAARRNLIHGDVAVAALHDLMHLRDGCPQDTNTGLCDLPALISKRAVARVDSPAANHIRHALAAWHAADAATAGYVFTHMLATQPQQRASRHAVHTRLEGATRANAADARMTAELVQEHAGCDLDDERAAMTAFARAVAGS